MNNKQPTVKLQELWDNGKLKRGDVFETRGGSVVSFLARSDMVKKYPFVFERETGFVTYTPGGTYKDDLCAMDIVRRVPIKKTFFINVYDGCGMAYTSEEQAKAAIDPDRKYLGTLTGEIEVFDE